LDKLPTVPLDAIVGTRYSKVLNYPASDDTELEARLSELRAVGVTAIRFVGSSMIDGLAILGKGCVGLVMEAILDGRLVALKIRRLDADRASMYEEARLLRLANSVNVGAQLISATKNLLVMELFDGLPLFKWANSVKLQKTVKLVLTRLLISCFKLDAIGLDHGELSRAPKNVLVLPRADVCIVDFESASMVRRVANVTSLLQYFLFGSISKSLGISTILPPRRNVLRALSQYKCEGSVESFLRLLETLRLKDYYEREGVSAEGGAVV
jgi:putative serine/threonine protein kinase